MAWYPNRVPRYVPDVQRYPDYHPLVVVRSDRLSLRDVRLLSDLGSSPHGRSAHVVVPRGLSRVARSGDGRVDVG